MLRKLFNDESGVIISAELILVLTIAVLGLVTGLGNLVATINVELDDVGNAFGALNQSYNAPGFGTSTVGGVAKSKGSTSGTKYTDGGDYCDTQANDACDIVVPAVGTAVAG